MEVIEQVTQNEGIPDSVIEKVERVLTLIDPTNLASGVTLPYQPINEVPFIPLNVSTSVVLMTPTSGNGLLISYPNLPFGKLLEHWVDNGLGEYIFESFVLSSVPLPDNFTIGRVVTSDTQITSGVALVADGTGSATIQGNFSGVVVQGGISQLYEGTLTSAQVFSSDRLSQLTSDQAFKKTIND